MKSFKGENGKYHFVYRTHNIINGKEYTGKHSTNNLNDGYYGTSKILEMAVEKYGIENFAVEILSFHDTKDKAYIEESNIVNDEYVSRLDTYNLIPGGVGGRWNSRNKVVVKDKDGNTMQVSVDDPRYLSRELVSVRTGLVNVKDKDGNIISVSVDDPRYLSGELVHHCKGNSIPDSHMKRVYMAKDNNGNFINIDRDDPRLNTGTLTKALSNTVTVIDKYGNQFQTSVDDPRYLTGELVHRMVGMVTAKDRNGNMLQVSKNDPRYLSGELVGCCKGIPKNYKKINCPYCGKEGAGPNMSRDHFENCKFKRLSELFESNKISDKRTYRVCPHCFIICDNAGLPRWHFDKCKKAPH